MSVKRLVQEIVDRAIVAPCAAVPSFRRTLEYAAHRVAYKELRARFIENGSHSRWSRDVRADLARRFEEIDRNVETASTPSEGLALAEALLSVDAPGDVVECGCFQGASTAKLSLVSRVVGKSLTVFDSFEGLPATDDGAATDRNARMGSEWVTEWSQGRYAASLQLVRDNVEKYGDVSVCTFRKGWFRDTVKPDALPPAVALAFVDVDLAPSVVECFLPIWPRLSDLGVFFLHDIGFIGVLQAVLDDKLWTERLREFPPILFGAGYGLGDDAPYLGFMVKGRSVSADYLNRLTVRK